MSEIFLLQTVTPTPSRSTRLINKKHVIVEAHKRNTAKIYVGLSYQYSGEGRRETDYEPLNIGECRFFSAPSEKNITYLWFYSASGNQAVTVRASDGAIAFLSRQDRSVVKHEIDDTLNNSNKSFVVPQFKRWKILAIYAKLSTTSTTGDRRMCLDIRDTSGNFLYKVFCSSVQTASTVKEYMFVSGLYRDETTFNLDLAIMSIPVDMILVETDILRVYDLIGIAPTADDLQVHIVYEETDLYE